MPNPKEGGGFSWGSHVLKKATAAAGGGVSTSSKELGEKLASRIVRTGPSLSSSSLSSSSSSSTTAVRSSLKRKRGLKRPASSFFDTLSHLDHDGGSQDGHPPLSHKALSDPLAKYDPEISIDSCDVVVGGRMATTTSPSGDGDQACPSTPSAAAAEVPSSWDKEEDEENILPSTCRFTPVVKKSDKQEKLQPVNFLSAFRGDSQTSGMRVRQIDKGWLERCSDQTKDSPSAFASSRGDGSPDPKSEDKQHQVLQEVQPSKWNCLVNDSASEDRKAVLAPAKPKPSKSSCESAMSSAAVIDAECADEEEKEKKQKPPKRPRRNRDAAKPAATEATKVNGASPMKEGPNPLNVYALGFEEPEVDIGMQSKSATNASKMLSREDLMRKRLGRDNYVKINLKKKTFVRGRKTMTGPKHRRMEFKKKMLAKEGKAAKAPVCFKCKEEGHWARDCAGFTDKLMPSGGKDGSAADEEEENQGDDFLTLEEASAMTGVQSGSHHSGSTLALLKEVSKDCNADIFDEKDDELLLQACARWNPSDESESPKATQKVPPYFSSDLPDDQCDRDIQKTLQKFGYSEFRSGQAEAIRNILRGQSTLVLMSTGSGKSLIYQIPAYLYCQRQNCITIVVSPLVSLMEDQVDGLPPALRAACLHSNLTETQRNKVTEQVKNGKLHFLLISPETLAGGGSTFAALLKDLPPIAFVCIDEAHCISQWSHNFRPAYLRLCKVIREKLGVQTILGLTATAPESTIKDIARHLSVCTDSGIVRGPLLPKNLTLSVSRDQDRDASLLKLLKGKRFETCDSIIIYCTRREECVRIATLIRTMLQGDVVDKVGKKACFVAEPYHAGLPAHKRRSVQANFMSGKLRVVVATVAFGMGIDKADIRAVLHYNMPKTFESYIQEIGRAGRDGEEAHCHLFLNSEGQDVNELKRHIYANSVDEVTVRKLLNTVFDKAKDADGLPGSPYKEVAASIEGVVEDLDLPEENISTLLCYLENDARKWIKLLNPAYATCKVRCYGGPRQFKVLAHKSPPIAAAVAVARKKGEDFSNVSQIEFPVVELAANMGWNSGVVKRELKNLQWTMADGRYKKSGVLVEFSDLAFHFEALKGLSGEEKDCLKEFLIDRTKRQERLEVYGLQRVFRSFSSVSHACYVECCDEANLGLSDKLKSFIKDYFMEDEKAVDPTSPSLLNKRPKNEQQIQGDVRQFVMTHSDHKWTGRAVARIFQGIGSPNFPAKQWGRVYRYWRSHLDVDFNDLCSLAKEAILSMRQGS